MGNRANWNEAVVLTGICPISPDAMSLQELVAASAGPPVAACRRAAADGPL